MKLVRKGPEPASVTAWKRKENEEWRPSWDGLQNPEKRDLKAALLEEQGHLCCYCCQRIEMAISHVEHVAPRSARPDLALEYANLVASCPGEEEEEDSPAQGLHCGHAKDEWYDPALLVSPLDPDCERSFAFTGYGEMRPHPQAPRPAAAAETIDRLSLDCAKLQRLRRAAIDAVLTDLHLLTPEDLATLAAAWEQRDADSRFIEFQPALLHVVRSL